MTKRIATIALIAVLMTSLLPTYTSGGAMQVAQAQEADTVRIDAAGASFAFPLMDLWRVKYAEINPHIELNYQSIGSGGGVKQHIEKTVNFAASDAPLRDSEYELAPGSITIPEMIGAISLAYNLPGVDAGLKLTEEALCGIYLGEITEWNDPRITEHNPGVSLPEKNVFVAQRSDGSGTTFAFTSYLTKVCPEWEEEVGAGKSVQWRTGFGAPGNEGVAALVKTNEGAIGYITLAYAFPGRHDGGGNPERRQDRLCDADAGQRVGRIGRGGRRRSQGLTRAGGESTCLRHRARTRTRLRAFRT